MKLLHLADLHLGKRVNGFSMLENQRDILQKILRIADDEQPQAVLIAGDVYDRAVPPEEAVALFDDFLVSLARRGLQVFIISGNHDSAERVAFGGRLMEAGGIHFSPVYHGEIAPLTLTDAYGPVRFWLIPFVKAAHVRPYYPDTELTTCADALQAIVTSLPLNAAERNVALVHQFITGAAVCDSEELSVGGLDEIPASVLDPFDYAALGHLHSPQKIGREGVRYAGSPLKYSFSEAAQHKSAAIVELGRKGQLSVRTMPLTPLRDMRRIGGAFADVMAAAGCEDYCEITLTDEEDVLNAVERLRTRYPNLMTLRYDNTRTRTESAVLGSESVEKKDPLTLFGELFEQQNGQPMNDDQRRCVSALIAEIWESGEVQP